MTRYHIYPHRVSPPSGSAAAPPAATPALGPSGSSSGAGVEPLCTSLDPALEAAFLFGLLQTRALKALQAYIYIYGTLQYMHRAMLQTRALKLTRCSPPS